MTYLDSLKGVFSKPTQANLIHRLIIRLSRKISYLFPREAYLSEDDLNRRLPVNRDGFVFVNWTQLREEIEALAIQHKNELRLLESLFVRYMKPFELAAEVLFPDDGHTEEDIITSSVLMYLSDFYSYSQNDYAPDARACLVEYLSANHLGPISDGFINGFQQDLAQLHRLIVSMNCIAEIIQGVLYEISAPITLQTIQNDCRLSLTASLIAWRMAPLMDWTAEYCRFLMGDRFIIDLDRDSISQPMINGQGESNACPPVVSKHNVVKKVSITEDELISLGYALKEDNYTVLQDDRTWRFTGSATLYAYMGYKIAKECELKQIPWSTLTRCLKVKGDSNYLKGEASTYKKTKKFPHGYLAIDDAVSRVFSNPSAGRPR